MKLKKLGLIPLRNFGIIDGEQKVYRSAQPEYDYEYKWLSKMLGLKHIINLRSESKHDHNFAPQHGIQVHDFEVADHHSPSKEQAEEYIDLIKDLTQKGEPVLIHCEHGHGRTSTFCVLTQVALGMTYEAALAEERERFHYKFKHKVQTDFLDNFLKTQPTETTLT